MWLSRSGHDQVLAVQEAGHFHGAAIALRADHTDRLPGQPARAPGMLLVAGDRLVGQNQIQPVGRQAPQQVIQAATLKFQLQVPAPQQRPQEALLEIP